MKITRMKTNRLENPMGYYVDTVHLSWVTEAEKSESKKQAYARIEVATCECFDNLVYDSGKVADADSLGFALELDWKPYTRYFWRVTIWGDKGDEVVSPIAWFETAKLDEPWIAKWITPDLGDKDIQPLLRKVVEIPSKVKRARAYVCGFGVYEFHINGQKVGDEYLTPDLNNYHAWVQYQTFDVTDMLTTGKNALGLMLGAGWYKGHYAFEDVKDFNLYGDQYAALMEVRVEYEDGKVETFVTDTSWKSHPSHIPFSDIYDGECYNANLYVNDWDMADLDESNWSGTNYIKLSYEKMSPRRSPKVKVMEEVKPIALITTPLGEKVLDMGQNMVGWLKFKANQPKGTEILIQHGEILQDDNFYRENLRNAKAEYRFISDGNSVELRPYFTFFGFRYAKISGWVGDIDINDFVGCVVYSELENTGSIETSNPLVNKLFENTVWGQKGNFLDVPTDCPQRDERMGWTGDAQVFSGTACFNMDSYAFLSKYLYDLYTEQSFFRGSVPHTVPSTYRMGHGAAAWGDASTIIPWNLYLHYGDKVILEQQLDSMMQWVDYIKLCEESKEGGKRLWSYGDQIGDWLALDKPLEGDDRRGGTKILYVGSSFYFYSATLTAEAAKTLGKTIIYEKYKQLADEVKVAIQKEFFTEDGTLTIQTQTAHVLALFMKFAPEQYIQKTVDGLVKLLEENDRHLKTGFVGTPYLCRVLSEYGHTDIAYDLLLTEGYPGWLYSVKMGATTIWERWNSVLPNGKLSGTDMNSLNHYAYGSVMEWVYRTIGGINPTVESPGFRHVKLIPQPNKKLDFANVSVETASGRYSTAWKYKEDGSLHLKVTVPFNCTATLTLPNSDEGDISLVAGTYVYDYMPK